MKDKQNDTNNLNSIEDQVDHISDKIPEDKKIKKQPSLFLISIIVLNFLFVGFIIYFFFGNRSDSLLNTSLKQNNQSNTESFEYDISKWIIYPKDGNNIGWTIKHPIDITPKANEKDVRFSVIANDEEKVLVTLRKSNKPLEVSLLDHLLNLTETDICDLKSSIAKEKISIYDGYKYTSDCSENTVGESILFGEKASYSIENPYNKGEFILIETYSDPSITDITQIETAKTIINTIKILSPEVSDKAQDKATNENNNVNEDAIDENTAGDNGKDKTENQTTTPVKPGYVEYKNTEIGYSIQYPEKYDVEENSAWKNADLILYGGGQIYDLIIQVWNTESEYKKFYSDNPAAAENMTVYKVGTKYVTLINLGKKSEIDEIIKNFKLIEN